MPSVMKKIFAGSALLCVIIFGAYVVVKNSSERLETEVGKAISERIENYCYPNKAFALCRFDNFEFNGGSKECIVGNIALEIDSKANIDSKMYKCSCVGGGSCPQGMLCDMMAPGWRCEEIEI